MDKEKLESFLEKELAGGPYFLVSVSAEAGDRYVVEIDSDEGVDIDECVRLTRAVEAEFPREDAADDYELEIGSAGLTSPFKVKRQYEKNVGSEVEVLTRDGRKLHGVLVEAEAEGFVLETVEKEKPEGAKRPVEVARRETFPYDAVKSVRCEIRF